MGYTTEFSGRIEITPPLSAEEVEYLKKFANTRRMARQEGPYFVDGKGFMGQDHDDGIIDHNAPPAGQPGLWCKWEPTDDGTAIEWNGHEKFYYAPEWMKYLIDHFVGPRPRAQYKMPFLKGHSLDGVIEAQGEESSDRWRLIVKDSKVYEQEASVVWAEDPKPI